MNFRSCIHTLTHTHTHTHACTHAHTQMNVHMFAHTITDINNVQLLGRVGADPREVGREDRPMVLFSLATDKHYKVTNDDGSGEWS